MLRRARARIKRPDDVVTAPPAAPSLLDTLPASPTHVLPPAPRPDLRPKEGADRREHTRKSLSVAVDMQTQSNFFAGRTRDISVGGLFVETEAALDIGCEVVVNLWLGGTRYELTSEVMWALTDREGKTRGVGVRFVRLPEKALRAIAAFIDERTPDGIAVETVGPEPPPLPL